MRCPSYRHPRGPLLTNKHPLLAFQRRVLIGRPVVTDRQLPTSKNDFRGAYQLGHGSDAETDCQHRPQSSKNVYDVSDYISRNNIETQALTPPSLGFIGKGKPRLSFCLTGYSSSTQRLNTLAMTASNIPAIAIPSPAAIIGQSE